MKTALSCIVTIGFCASWLTWDSLGNNFAVSRLVNSNVSAESQIPLGNRTTLLSMDTTNATEFIAQGTEPFWNVAVSKRGIVYTSPDTKKQTFPYVAPMKAAARPEDLVRVYRLKGKPEGMLLIKQVSACSNGMSEKNFPYSAVLVLGNTVLEGCAQKK